MLHGMHSRSRWQTLCDYCQEWLNPKQAKIMWPQWTLNRTPKKWIQWTPKLSTCVIASRAQILSLFIGIHYHLKNYVKSSKAVTRCVVCSSGCGSYNRQLRHRVHGRLDMHTHDTYCTHWHQYCSSSTCTVFLPHYQTNQSINLSIQTNPHACVCAVRKTGCPIPFHVYTYAQICINDRSYPSMNPIIGPMHSRVRKCVDAYAHTYTHSPAITLPRSFILSQFL